MRYITPDWPAPSNIKAYTTTKNLWGDADTTPKSPEQRRKLEALFSLPETTIWLTQTHGNVAVAANSKNMNADADASYTDKPNTACLVLTADCLPILICNQQGTKVAAIHAGWRGLTSGIIESTLNALGEPGSHLMAWLGPAIGPDKFEVGPDVYQAFTQQDALAVAAFKPLNEGKWLADLYHLARLRLQQGGISSIHGGNFCTYSQSDLFYSYRRDNKNTGRMASVIWLETLAR